MIQKIYSPSIILSSVDTGNQLSPETVTLLQSLDSFEKEVNILSEELGRIDNSIKALRNDFDNLAQGVYQLGSVSTELFGKGGSNKAKGLLAVASLAIKSAGYATQQYKEKKNEESYYAKRKEILEQKELVADEKLPNIIAARDRFCKNIESKIQALYSLEASKLVEISDPSIDSSVGMMRMAMGMHIKSKYLVAVMEYCIAEMNAWQRGKHNSSASKPSVDIVLTEEISQWEHNYCSSMPWDLYLVHVLNQKAGSIPLSIAFLLSSPALLRCYVGVSLAAAENCPSGLIVLGKNSKGTVMNPLVLNNPYYLHCLSISDLFKPLKRPSSFSLGDLLVLLIIPAVLFGLLMLLFHLEEKTGWRIFFMLPILSWIAIAINYLQNNMLNILPCYRKVFRYNRIFKSLRDKVIEVEDCKEFHILY